MKWTNKTGTLPGIGPFCPSPQCGVKQQPERSVNRHKRVEIGQKPGQRVVKLERAPQYAF